MDLLAINVVKKKLIKKLAPLSESGMLQAKAGTADA
jgi:hypothetical protein